MIKNDVYVAENSELLHPLPTTHAHTADFTSNKLIGIHRTSVEISLHSLYVSGFKAIQGPASFRHKA